MTPSPLTTVLLIAGVALVSWGSVRLAARRRRRPAPHVSRSAHSHARVSASRPQRRLDRRPHGRGPHDLRCPAGRTLAQRHPTRRPADR